MLSKMRQAVAKYLRSEYYKREDDLCGFRLLKKLWNNTPRDRRATFFNNPARIGQVLQSLKVAYRVF